MVEGADDGVVKSIVDFKDVAFLVDLGTVKTFSAGGFFGLVAFGFKSSGESRHTMLILTGDTFFLRGVGVG